MPCYVAFGKCFVSQPLHSPTTSLARSAPLPAVYSVENAAAAAVTGQLHERDASGLAHVTPTVATCSSGMRSAGRACEGKQDVTREAATAHCTLVLLELYAVDAEEGDASPASFANHAAAVQTRKVMAQALLHSGSA